MDPTYRFKDHSKESLLQKQSPKPTNIKKIQIPLIITFLISFIILSLLIISAINSSLFLNKSTTESPYLPTPPNSADSVRFICSFTPYKYTCLQTLYSMITNDNSISSLHTHPKLISTLFLKSSVQQLTELTRLPTSLIPKSNHYPKTKLALLECQTLFYNSLSQLNMSLAVINDYPEDDWWLTGEKINDVTTWMSEAMADQEKCLDGLEEKEMDPTVVSEVRVKVRKSKRYMDNTLAFFFNIYNVVYGLYPPPVADVEDGLLTYVCIFIFSWQYLVLIFLFCLLLRISP